VGERVERIDGIAYRTAETEQGDDAPFALLLHGFPGFLAGVKV
jgi:hypothetical protein